MNGLSVVFVCVAIVSIIILPRRWVFLPFLAGACYMTYGQGIKIGPFNFFVIRLLILAGIVRVILKRERLAGRLNKLDRMVIAWAAVAVLSCLGHEEPPAALVFRLGLVFDNAGIYFLARIFIRSLEDVVFLCRFIAILLVPVALEMISEKMTGQNRFAAFGGVAPDCTIREGKIRGQGPFMHPILAGTVGALSLPLMAALLRHERKVAQVGLAATAAIVYCSGSSGPMMSAIFAVGALLFWRYRQYMSKLRWLAVFSYIGLDLMMKVPAYYLLGRMDLAGGSTGFHRAQLINSAINHLSEWWLIGTDYTRHWMPTGVSWSPNHTDITNQYISMGILGGLPLMFTFIGMLVLGFVGVGRALRASRRMAMKWKFMIWAMGASLFANAATCISVSYFDQSFLFLYVVLGAVGTLWGLPDFSPKAAVAASGFPTSGEWAAKSAV